MEEEVIYAILCSLEEWDKNVNKIKNKLNKKNTPAHVEKKPSVGRLRILGHRAILNQTIAF